MDSFFQTETRIWDRKKQEYVTVKIRVDFDKAKLAHHLAEKAYHNKTKRSRIQGGLITAVLK